MKVPLTINDFLDRSLAVYPDRLAIVDEPDQPASPWSNLTYADWGEIRRSMGVAMDEMGLPMAIRLAEVLPSLNSLVSRVALTAIPTMLLSFPLLP